MQFLRLLHVLGVVVWVGGMFFAHMALRPAAQALPPPQRLPLLVATLSRFLGWAGVAVAAILGSGVAMLVLRDSGAATAPGVQAMAGLGLTMAAIYAFIVAVPWRALRTAVAAQDWPRGGAAMGRIRLLVQVNLVLGLATIVIAYLWR